MVRIEGEKGSLERASLSLNRLGITLPVSRDKIPRARKQRVNLKIVFHSGESQTNARFLNWAMEIIIPKLEKIKYHQTVKGKLETTVELSAVGNRGNPHLAVYEARL
ncbi:MAG TPA: hypothetical protein DCP31_18670 [Cyanobacteria bacterium UBA8543]|nr:hypothetical protein [Cyanobacteria bacterium UBA8543]